MSEMAPFNIMAKPVCGVCNLDCCYCYYTMKPRELYPGNAKFQMSEPVLESYVRQYLQAMPVRCEFGWQGGEPTLAGLDFFKKAVALQKQYAAEGQIVTNALQTNGTLLDEEWCQFLAEHNFLVGISLDGPAQWHDTFRRDHANNRTFHRAWAGLELLRKHGVEFNVLVTLNSANAPHAGDIYRYFVNRGVQYMQFIPILERAADGTPTPFSCTPQQFGKFMLDVYEVWASRDVGKVSERLIDCVLHTVIYGHASTCCYARKCGNAHVLEWNGDLYACDHFVYAEWKIGNIMERPLAELVQDPRLAEFDRMKLDLPSRCTTSRFLPFCFGGCPKHHMPIGTSADRYNYFCEGLKAFFEKAIPELYDMAQYIKDGQLPPPRKAPAKSASSGPVDPNARCPCGSGRKHKNCCGK